MTKERTVVAKWTLRVLASAPYDASGQEHGGLEQLGCCCTPGAEGCDSQVDVGAQAGGTGRRENSKGSEHEMDFGHLLFLGVPILGCFFFKGTPKGKPPLCRP